MASGIILHDFNMTTLQDIILYAMLPDEMVLEHSRYPYVSHSDLVRGLFDWDYDTSKGYMVNVQLQPLTIPIDRIKMTPNNFELKLGRRKPNKKYENGKWIWVNASMWINNRRKPDGWNENFVWFNSRGIPFVRDPNARGQWVDYQGHPLKTGVWRTMLPSEMREFCDIREEEWQEWYRENETALLSVSD